MPHPRGFEMHFGVRLGLKKVGNLLGFGRRRSVVGF